MEHIVATGGNVTHIPGLGNVQAIPVSTVQGLTLNTGTGGLQAITGTGGLQTITGAGGLQTITGTGGLQAITGTGGLQAIAGAGGLQAITGLANVQGLWYTTNYTTDGSVGQILTSASAVPAVQVELGSSDIARQVNQQVQTQYGNIQVQVGTLQPQQITTKVEPEEQKISKSRIRQTGGERVPCPECGKTVSCNATLRDHMRTHTGERPFQCSECGLAFAQRSNLRMHKRLHTGERPYMCGICGKTFARSSHLPAHMRTHTGEKPYICTECNHSFITAQQLKNHFRVHTGEKPWKCDLCDAAFTHSSSLSTHKKKHTGQKPYACEKCKKTFFFSSALDKHMKVHSKSRPFKCENCDKAFKYKESLTVHKDKYCGREISKKPRAARKPDAKKPGPKPGSGRKYVQKRKGRPRGRPRKRGRWGKRGRPKKTLNEEDEEYEDFDGDLEEMPKHQDPVALEEENIPEVEVDIGLSEAPFTNPKIDTKDNITRIVQENDPLEGNQLITTGPPCVDQFPSRPVGNMQIKIENQQLQTVKLEQQLQGMQQQISQQQLSQLMPQQSLAAIQSIHGDHLETGTNTIHIDDATGLTIVSAEEASSQHAMVEGANGSVQLVTLHSQLPLQLVQQDAQGQVTTHQLITRDGVQMWYPRQYQ